MGSISCRKQSLVKQEACPKPLKNYSIRQVDGKRKLVECEPVAPSLAEDFSIQSNYIYGRSRSSAYRLQSDPVDFEQKVKDLIS